MNKSASDSLVSIIMPAYNARDTIGAAIDSVLDQTYRHFELIIVDDASTDTTLDIANSYLDSRVKVIENHSNSGPGVARNRAIPICSGDWVTLIDADDLWDRRRLEVFLSSDVGPLDNTMLADDIEEFYDTPDGIRKWGTVWNRQIIFTGGLTTLSPAEYIACKRWVMQPLIPRHAIIDNKLVYAGFPVSEDVEFYIRLMKIAHLRLKFVPHAGYLYRRTPGSISTHPKRSQLVKRMLIGLQNEINFSESETKSIVDKIAKLDRNIQYEPFLQAMKNGDTANICKLLISHPSYLLEFLKRIPDTFSYRLHVLLHRGSSR